MDTKAGRLPYKRICRGKGREERHRSLRNQRIKLSSISSTFNNVLKRGELTVEKVADDNIVEGIKFHLYGTSKDGIKVDEYAVTDKDGIARFKDVLVSGIAPYTVEEINVDEDKYIAPDKQTVTIKWKENSELTFKNKLKKASILTVYKSGEVFYRVVTASTDNGEKTYQPVYRNLSLAGAKYEIRAAADIVTEDGKKYIEFI